VIAIRSGAFVFPFLMLFLTTQRGLSLPQAGSALSLYGAGSVCSSLLGGQLADRWGRRPTFLLSMCGGALALGCLALVRTPTALFCTCFVFGVFGEMHRPAVSAAIGDVVPADRQVTAFGHLYWAHNLGFAIAPFSAGLLVSQLGFGSLFVVQVATLSACLLCALRYFRETRPEHPAGAPRSAPPFAFGGVLRDHRFALFLAAFLPLTMLMLQTISVLPMRMHQSGIDAAAYGRIISINGVMIVVLQPWLLARLLPLPRTAVLACGALALGIGYMGHAFADSTGTHIAALALWTLGEISVVPIAGGMVSELARPELRGRYQGAYGVTWSFASFASPWIATSALSRIGVHGWGYSCAAAGACSALLYVAFGAMRRDSAKLQETTEPSM
jgi:MFS family permease